MKNIKVSQADPQPQGEVAPVGGSPEPQANVGVPDQQPQRQTVHGIQPQVEFSRKFVQALQPFVQFLQTDPYLAENPDLQSRLVTKAVELQKLIMK